MSRHTTSFAGAVAIVTGGASGIGRALGVALAARGARVVLADRDGEAAERIAASIRSEGERAEAARVDVTDRAAVFALIEATARSAGRLDYLFNNAGISIDGEFADLTFDHWRTVFEVDFWGVLHGCQAAYPLMRSQGFGHIVNTASLAGLIPGGLTSPYSAAKHAVVGLSLSLRAEARAYGIRVSTLCPGWLDTPIHSATPVITAYQNAPRNRAMAARMRAPTAERCVDAMLSGVRANRGVIFVPASQRPYWWLHRLNPEIIPAFFASVIRTLKRNAQLDGWDVT